MAADVAASSHDVHVSVQATGTGYLNCPLMTMPRASAPVHWLLGMVTTMS